MINNKYYLVNNNNKNLFKLKKIIMNNKYYN